ncbi:MAG: hypothetical protein KGH94_01745 [Candidatus Micrarchaeota archaeon]|nr:hypothetical protein [Candidatus Micrarchaeota archaeon]
MSGKNKGKPKSAVDSALEDAKKLTDAGIKANELVEFCKWFRGLTKEESDKILNGLRAQVRKEEAKLN